MALFDRFKKSSAENTAAEKSVEPSQVEQLVPSKSDAPEDSPKRGFFARLKQGLSKTTQLLKTDIRDLFKSEGQFVDDTFLEKLKRALVHTDMGPQPANQIAEEIATQFRARVIHMRDALEVVKSKLKELIGQEESPLTMAVTGPTVIMVCGVNGSGKTTSIAKLTQLFRKQGKQVVLGAGDTFRAAAVEQLGIWADRLGAEVVKGPPGSDPASVAFSAVKQAIDTGADVCIVDTAGRLQTQQNLMAELTKIHRVIGKQIPDAPHDVLLVLDATAGQNGISQARGFSDAVKCTGIVLAKIDGTAKGGVIVPIRQQFGLPVKYVGVGESADDLGVFKPAEFVDAMFEGLDDEA
ncbi:MAG: signal recognition particle-docking protein FtsY [Pirellulales bacterium]|nr:signal recognition particle-docking protein FtsY [Pirellulales bacterium]